MQDDQFTRLFKYMEKRFDDIDNQLELTAEKLATDKILNHLDAVRETLDSDELEPALQTAQLNQRQASLDDHEKRIARLERTTA